MLRGQQIVNQSSSFERFPLAHPEVSMSDLRSCMKKLGIVVNYHNALRNCQSRVKPGAKIRISIGHNPDLVSFFLGG